MAKRERSPSPGGYRKNPFRDEFKEIGAEVSRLSIRQHRRFKGNARDKNKLGDLEKRARKLPEQFREPLLKQIQYQKAIFPGRAEDNTSTYIHNVAKHCDFCDQPALPGSNYCSTHCGIRSAKEDHKNDKV